MAHCHDWSHSEFGHATFVTLACPELLSPGLGLREQHLMSCVCVNNLPVETLLQRYSIASSYPVYLCYNIAILKKKYQSISSER